MHRPPLLAAALFVAALFAPTANASAPDAWNAHYRDVLARCLAASQLDRAHPDSDLMLFSDDLGTALIVRGKPEGKSAEVRKLCIVRRGERGALEIQPVDDGIDPRTLPKR
ncbi:MAG TPA: hypothetical protein VLF18_17005 [Tahibacter sp.]|uniref:hypothetical protein n=1 Tax=Tahibacter sp. TaxID=2056211 RepID=UPI002B56F702|nr:hypothetical protein [Tahibacter sp.]HSX61892.1 hypothetical protein [Tahibacter sp.]